MNLLKKLLRWLKPKPKSLINELSVDKLTAGTLTATVRVSDKPTELMQATCGTDAVKAWTLAESDSQNYGKTVSWWILADTGKVRPRVIRLAGAVKDTESRLVELRSITGHVYVLGYETLVHVSSEPMYEQ